MWSLLWGFMGLFEGGMMGWESFLVVCKEGRAFVCAKDETRSKRLGLKRECEINFESIIWIYAIL